jgi:hypothetical protein
LRGDWQPEAENRRDTERPVHRVSLDFRVAKIDDRSGFFVVAKDRVTFIAKRPYLMLVLSMVK